MASTREHDSPYPSTADRHVSWGEMIYHVDLLRDDLNSLRGDVRDGLGSVVAEIHRGRSVVRWTVTAAIMFSGVLSGIIVAIATRGGT